MSRNAILYKKRIQVISISKLFKYLGRLESPLSARLKAQAGYGKFKSDYGHSNLNLKHRDKALIRKFTSLERL